MLLHESSLQLHEVGKENGPSLSNHWGSEAQGGRTAPNTAMVAWARCGTEALPTPSFCVCKVRPPEPVKEGACTGEGSGKGLPSGKSLNPCVLKARNLGQMFQMKVDLWEKTQGSKDYSGLTQHRIFSENTSPGVPLRSPIPRDLRPYNPGQIDPVRQIKAGEASK